MENIPPADCRNRLVALGLTTVQGVDYQLNIWKSAIMVGITNLISGTFQQFKTLCRTLHQKLNTYYEW